MLKEISVKSLQNCPFKHSPFLIKEVYSSTTSQIRETLCKAYRTRPYKTSPFLGTMKHHFQAYAKVRYFY